MKIKSGGLQEALEKFIEKNKDFILNESEIMSLMI